MGAVRLTRVIVVAAGLLVAVPSAVAAQSLADLARQTDVQRRSTPAPAPVIAIGSDAFQDVRLTDALFAQYASTQEAVERLLLGQQVRAERFTQRRRDYRPGTDATFLYAGEPELVQAIVTMGLTPQLLEDIAWSISRAYDERVSDPTPVRLDNRAWVLRNNARLRELDQRLQFIRAGFGPSPVR